MDLHRTLPELPVDQHALTISKLERAQITVKELLALDALEIAKKSGVGVPDVRKLSADIIDALHRDMGLGGQQRSEYDAEILLEEGAPTPGPSVNSTAPSPASQLSISTLDSTVDAALGGGISTGYVTEIAGESGCGKTQLLLHLLLAVQLPPPHGLGRSALHISTESDLSTTRLTQLLSEHPYISSLPANVQRPSLENIRSITTIDLESQDHIINFQVPVAVERYNVGLVVIDSVTANYRAELSAGDPDTLVTRSRELRQLGHLLRSLAVKHDLAVVVANQVSDQFGDVTDPLWTEMLDGGSEGNQAGTSFQSDTAEKSVLNPPRHADRLGPSLLHQDQSQLSSSSPTPAVRSGSLATQATSTSAADNNNHTMEGNTMTLTLPSLETTLTLEHQKPFFTGWGDPYVSLSMGSTQLNLKTPALGVVWSNQIGCRIVLKVKMQELPPDTPYEPNVIGTHENTRSDMPSSAPMSQKPPSIPDSEDSEEFECPPEIEALISASNLEQPLDSGELKGSATGTGQNPTTIHLEESATSSPAQLYASRLRKVRAMEVVFAPWILGNAHPDPDSVKNRSSPVGVAEFEILPSGIRGLDTH